MAKKKGKYAASKARDKKSLYKRWWFWGLALVLCVGGCGNSGDTKTVATEPSITETVKITEATIIPTTEELVAETTTAPTTEPTSEENTMVPSTLVQPAEETEYQSTYVLNTNSMKFHYSSCSSADDIKDSNKDTFTGTRDEIIAKGYEPCGRCTP